MWEKRFDYIDLGIIAVALAISDVVSKYNGGFVLTLAAVFIVSLALNCVKSFFENRRRT